MSVYMSLTSRLHIQDPICIFKQPYILKQQPKPPSVCDCSVFIIVWHGGSHVFIDENKSPGRATAASSFEAAWEQFNLHAFPSVTVNANCGSHFRGSFYFVLFHFLPPTVCNVEEKGGIGWRFSWSPFESTLAFLLMKRAWTFFLGWRI